MFKIKRDNKNIWLIISGLIFAILVIVLIDPKSTEIATTLLYVSLLVMFFGFFSPLSSKKIETSLSKTGNILKRIGLMLMTFFFPGIFMAPYVSFVGCFDWWNQGCYIESFPIYKMLTNLGILRMIIIGLVLILIARTFFKLKK